VRTARHRRPLILAVDQGTHASRAALFEANGRMLKCFTQPVTLERDGPCVEQDAEALLRSVQSVIADALRYARAVGGQVQRAGLATQRSTVVAWNRQSGRALAPALSWQDTRAEARLAVLAERRDALHATTGLVPSPHYGASKLAWLLGEVPSVAQAAREGRLALGPLAAYLLFHLLEDHPLVVDHANAARTLLWDLETRDWAPWLLAAFGIERSLLPECRPTCSDYGRLAGTEVHVMTVTGDQCAAAYAGGEPSTDTVVCNLGSGAFALRPTGERVLRAPELLSGLIDSSDGRTTYALEGTVNGAGSALEWAARSWQLQYTPEDLDRLIAHEARPPLFLNAVGGIGSPWWRTDLEPRLLDADPAGCRNDPAPCLAAVVESIAFLLTANLRTLCAIEPGVRRVVAGGGLSHSDALLGRLAALSGLPVERLSEPEATLRGVAWLAGDRPPGWRRDAAKRFEPISDPALEERCGRLLALLER
jgi:glycerol kinase